MTTKKTTRARARGTKKTTRARTARKRADPQAALRERGLRLMARAWLVTSLHHLDPAPKLEQAAMDFYEALERFDGAIGDHGYAGHNFAPLIVAYFGEDYVADHVIDELKGLTVNRGLFKQGELLDRAREEGRRDVLQHISREEHDAAMAALAAEGKATAPSH